MFSRSFAMDLAVLGAAGAVAIGGGVFLDQTLRKTIGAPGILDRNDGVWAATTATVSATVKFQTFSVAVSDGSISYGSVAALATKSTLPSSLNDSQTVTNNGNSTEDINIQGIDAFVVGGGGTNWELSTAGAGADQYVHYFSSDAFTTSASLDENSFQLFKNDASVNQNTTLDLMILMPSSDSNNGATMDTSVTLQATAP